MSTRERKSVRVRSGWRVWVTIVVIVIVIHIVFFSFFKVRYLRIFQTELPGEEGESSFPRLDAPFSYVQLYEKSEVPPTTRQAPTIEKAIDEATFLDELGDISTELIPIERTGGGSPGLAGSRKATVEPKPLYIPWPRYPKNFKGSREGSVELLLFVNENGEVENVKLSRGLPHEELNRIAIGSARKIRFTPGTEKGIPTSMWVKLTIAFQSQ